MKKLIVPLASLILTLGLMAGCGKTTPLLAATDYELDPESKVTSREVSIGDNAETFLAAYGDYKIFTSIEGGEYQVFAPDEIPFDSSVTLLLPTFFIDGLPTDLDQFCKENEIEKSGLTDTLTSDEFLKSHTVVYYYLLLHGKTAPSLISVPNTWTTMKTPHIYNKTSKARLRDSLCELESPNIHLLYHEERA